MDEIAYWLMIRSVGGSTAGYEDGGMRAERTTLTAVCGVSALLKDLHRNVPSIDICAVHGLFSTHRVLLVPKLDDPFDFIFVLLAASVPCSRDARIVDGTELSEEIVQERGRCRERVEVMPWKLTYGPREGIRGR